MKVKTKKFTLELSEKQMAMLDRLSEVSMKPKTALVREAIDLLFKTPGGQYE